MKILYWDRNGFCLWQKRLEKDRFKWPERASDVLQIGPRELMWLVEGLEIAQKGAHGSLSYSTQDSTQALLFNEAEAFSSVEEEKVCACGCVKSRIGEDVSEQLDIVPAKIQVIRHVRYKYVCKTCEGVEADEPAVSIAPAPMQLIPRSVATCGLLAHVLTCKFVDTIPPSDFPGAYMSGVRPLAFPDRAGCGWQPVTLGISRFPYKEFVYMLRFSDSVGPVRHSR